MRRFTDTTIFTDVGRITTSQLTSQRLYTLFRPISHVASSPPTPVTLTRLAFPHLSPLPCSFCLSQCKGLRNPSDCHTAVASVTSQSHSSHCLRFLCFVVVHCTDQAIVSVSFWSPPRGVLKVAPSTRQAGSEAQPTSEQFRPIPRDHNHSQPIRPLYDSLVIRLSIKRPHYCISTIFYHIRLILRRHRLKYHLPIQVPIVFLTWPTKSRFPFLVFAFRRPI